MRRMMSPLVPSIAYTLLLAASMAGSALLLPATALGPAGEAPPNMAADPGPTPFESSGGVDAATYDDVHAYLNAVRQASHNVLVSSCGYSAEGYPIPAVFVWDRAGTGGGWETDPTQPVIMITASIHAGETCGTDALLLLLRRIAKGLEPRLISHARLILVPVFNVDGFRDRTMFHRFTQNGPASGFGTRRNAQNLDLNRDFCKLDSPEVRAIVRLFSQFQPDIFIDLHTDDRAWGINTTSCTTPPSIRPTRVAATGWYGRNSFPSSTRAWRRRAS